VIWIRSKSESRTNSLRPGCPIPPSSGIEPGAPEPLAHHIRTSHKAVSELASSDGALSESAKEAPIERMTQYCPDAQHEDLISMSAAPVAAELADR
jgi:hypothetical protein